MNLFKKTQETCILATDFNELSKEHILWREQHTRRMEIYRKYNELITYLEDSLEILTNPIDQQKIRKQIKKIKKLRDRYDEPSILSIRFDENYMNNPKQAVLKIKKRENYE